MSELTGPEVRRSGVERGEHASSTGGDESGESGAPDAALRARPNSGFGPDFAEKVARAGREVGGHHHVAGRQDHPEGCRCTRCLGFTAGANGTAVTRTVTGAYSRVQIQPRAAEVAEGIALALRDEQLYRESFRSAIDACAIVLVRLERAEAALAQVDEQTADNPLVAYLDRDGDPFAKLRSDAARWASVAKGYLNDLGLTPRSLAAIAKDTGIARSTRASAALSALAEHVERAHA